MRLPILAVVLLAVAQPVRAAAQRAPSADSAAAVDTLPTSARVVDEKDLTTKPQLANRSAIVRLLQRNYPDALREQGKTGNVTVAMVIDPAGVPHAVRVTGSSGIPQFDEASLRVTRAMRFSPPLLNGTPVWVRVQVPVEFSLVR